MSTTSANVLVLYYVLTLNLREVALSLCKLGQNMSTYHFVLVIEDEHGRRRILGDTSDAATADQNALILLACDPLYATYFYGPPELHPKKYQVCTENWPTPTLGHDALMNCVHAYRSYMGIPRLGSFM